MKKRWAFLTVLIALALGVGAGLLFGQEGRAAMQLSLSCMLLSEAEKAGHLTPEKRKALIEKLAASDSLDATERQMRARLASGCSIF